MSHDAAKEAAKDAVHESPPETHATRLVVWDLPGAIGRGEAFRIRVGIRCEHACQPAGWRLEVCDHAGALVASAAPEGEPEPGTEALFAASIPLTAPGEEGRFEWRVGATPSAHGPGVAAHAAASTRFALQVVPEADCHLTVVVADRDTQLPVPGARVVAHPYRAVADSAGIATLALPRGTYRVFVSGNGFFPLRVDAELAADSTIRAELEPDTGPSDAQMWP